MNIQSTTNRVNNLHKCVIYFSGHSYSHFKKHCGLLKKIKISMIFIIKSIIGLDHNNAPQLGLYLISNHVSYHAALAEEKIWSTPNCFMLRCACQGMAVIG